MFLVYTGIYTYILVYTNYKSIYFYIQVYTKIIILIQGVRIPYDQGVNSAKTMMTHSLNREASQLLCEAMTCRVEDGDPCAEHWKDSSGRALAPDRFWNQTMASMIASDNAGPCLGIELNIWERAKVGIHFN